MRSTLDVVDDDVDVGADAVDDDVVDDDVDVGDGRGLHDDHRTMVTSLNCYRMNRMNSSRASQCFEILVEVQLSSLLWELRNWQLLPKGLRNKRL